MARQRHLLFALIQFSTRNFSATGRKKRKVFLGVWRRKFIAFLLLVILGISITVFPAKSQLYTEIIYPDVAKNTEILLQQSQILYERGAYNEAIALLQQAIAEFVATGERLKGAIASRNLALVYQKLGQWEEAKDAIAHSLNLLETPGIGNYPKVYASVLEIQGQLELTIGHSDRALESWRKATQIYQQIEDNEGYLRGQVYQSVALQQLGQYRAALRLLRPHVREVMQLDNSSLKVSALQNLGNIARVVGDREILEEVLAPFLPPIEDKKRNDLDIAKWLLEQSFEVAKNLKSPQEMAESSISLGNIERAAYYRAKDAYDRVPTQEENNFEKQAGFKDRAIEYYQTAREIATSPLTAIEAQLNQISLLVEFEKRSETALNKGTTSEQVERQLNQLPELRSRLDSLPLSHQTVDARINLAQSLIDLNFNKYTQIIQALLLQASEQGKELEDARLESYALGNLGKLYRAKGNADNALNLTKDALLVAEEARSPDIRYQWEWQLGRLLAEEGKVKDAILAYEEAIETLEIVRKDLLTLKNPDFRFTFRDNVEPVYRELANLLLPLGDTHLSPENLKKSIYYIDALQVAEIEDFLRCNLQPAIANSTLGANQQQNAIAALNEHLQQIVQVDPTVAFIYTIILPQQFATILKLPQSEQLLYQIRAIDEQTVKTTIEQANESSRKPTFARSDGKPLQDLYQWLLEPFAKELESNGVKSLVFVLDNNLRSLPMAALHDGEKFLIERGYSVSVAPSVQLLNPKPFKVEETNALILGAIKDRPGLPSLMPAVPRQIEQLSQILNNFEILTNGQFTRNSFQDKVSSNDYNILHLITHGKFSSSFEETYILTDDESSDRGNYYLDINELSSLLHSTNSNHPIELLVFSACQTASGDRRAVLGMAGIAVKSGAEGTIGTLWLAEQNSANELMVQFYKNLVERKVSKAEALRLAQIELLQSDSTQIPRHWASFILVGY